MMLAGFVERPLWNISTSIQTYGHRSQDLKGKRIIYTASSLETPFLDPFFATGDVKRDEIELINVDANAKVAQYLTSNVDGIISAGPTLALVQDKRPSRLVLFADFGLNLPSFGLVASEAGIAKKAAEYPAGDEPG